MNKPRRVLALTRHYWPIVNDDTLRLHSWLQRLTAEGLDAIVITPSWHASWPNRLVVDEILVIRAGQPSKYPWLAGHYARQLTAVISRLAAEQDVIYCDSPGGEAAAILRSGQSKRLAGCVVRCDSLCLQSYASAVLRAKLVDACRRADAVLTPDSASYRTLQAAGIPQASLIRVPTHSGVKLDRSPAARHEARQVLSRANHDLFAKSTDRVLLCPGELHDRWELELLIRALAPLVDRHRSLRVWLHGDSRQRPFFYELLRGYGIHRAVAMPGNFTDLEPLLQAADLCVFPAPGAGSGWLLPTCLASSLPVLVRASAPARNLLGEQHRFLFDTDQPHELRDIIQDWLLSPAAWTREASVLQRLTLSAARPAFGSQELFHCLREKV